MKTLIATILFLFLAIPSTVRAVTATTPEPVWFTAVPREDGTAGTLEIKDPILIYASLSNATKDPILYTVVFTVQQQLVTTKSVTVPGYTQQSISILSQMPADTTVVAATITKALDKDKKEIPTLVGPIGSVTISPTQTITMPKITVTKGAIGKIVTYLESFRLRKLEYFTTLKDKSKSILDTTTIKDVSVLLQPEPLDTSTGDAVTPPEKKDSTKTLAYLQLLYATGGKWFFEHKTLYFVTIILAVLLILRFIFRRLF